MFRLLLPKGNFYCTVYRAAAGLNADFFWTDKFNLIFVFLTSNTISPLLVDGALYDDGHLPTTLAAPSYSVSNRRELAMLKEKLTAVLGLVMGSSPILDHFLDCHIKWVLAGCRGIMAQIGRKRPLERKFWAKFWSHMQSGWVLAGQGLVLWPRLVLLVLWPRLMLLV